MNTDSSTAQSMSTFTCDVGAVLPGFVRDTGLAVWGRYAAVNDEFVPIHMDNEAGRAAGMPGAFGMGNLQISYMHCLLRDWLGPMGRIQSVSARFRKPNLAGRVTAAGVVTEVRGEADGQVVTVELTVTDELQDVLSAGTATVLVTGGAH
ncbi:MaoC/PaaZ C-terminal domain-containing protein [Rhodococcus sp. SORGH_AS_0301]|uniref:MaoC family dehydratase n=1 Tax=Rhodococcus sp. SORGH_AS_0301 TaxID=3041780 RepID=UPI002786CFCE|nr:MaoC/PaaZ C-terminal domain-containing protein [Rhodococcus sp. SORGH_AS_0301]MDQ1178580.1 acyl dehydratase [Rhodococcus sp. SORGH_AS_0301]